MITHSARKTGQQKELWGGGWRWHGRRGEEGLDET